MQCQVSAAFGVKLAWRTSHTFLSAPAVLPSISLKLFVPAAPSAKTPVVIVGAGPTGLTLSILLGKLGVPNLVLDAAKALPNHPQVMQYDD